MARYQATDRQIILSLINAIAQHPVVSESKVYEPVINDSTTAPEAIGISNYRTFGGLELIEPGLTLAIYPFHSNYHNIKGTISPTAMDKSIRWEPYTLGAPTNETYQDLGKMKLVVQLYYLDPNFNLESQISSRSFSKNYYLEGQFGDRIQYGEGDISSNSNYPSEERTLTVKVIPGEEILRDWITILRYVLRDINQLKPFTVRRPTILSVDYPSSNWIRNSENLIFHTAYILVEYDLYESKQFPMFEFPKPQLHIEEEILP